MNVFPYDNAWKANEFFYFIIKQRMMMVPYGHALFSLRVSHKPFKCVSLLLSM